MDSLLAIAVAVTSRLVGEKSSTMMLGFVNFKLLIDSYKPSIESCLPTSLGYLCFLNTYTYFDYRIYLQFWCEHD